MLCNIKVSKLKNFRFNQLADRVDFNVLGNDEEQYYPNGEISKSYQVEINKIGDRALLSDNEIDDYIRKLFKWRRP